MVAALTSAVVGLDGRVSIGASGAVSIRLQVATDLAFTAGVAYSSAETLVNGNAIAQVTGLAAGTWYYYRVGMTESGGAETFTAANSRYRLRTAPTGQASFSFSFASCCDATDSSAMSAVAARTDDFFCHLGDLYYDDGASKSVSSYRSHMLAKIKAPNHAPVFTSRPIIYTPSDHDFGMENGGTGATSGSAQPNYNQVYRELFPTPSLPGGTLGVYHTFVWGRIRFIVLDTRTFKSAPTAMDNSSKTALGSTQKAWVKSTITAATEPLIVFVQESPWIGAATSSGGAADGWPGYSTERAELGAFCVASGKKFAMIAGDMHAVGADSGANSVGGFPVFHGAPLHNDTSYKGGPYSSGTYPTKSNTGPVISAYGRIVVTDSGTSISLAFTGYTADNTARITQTSTFATTATSGGGVGGSPTVAVAAKILYGNMQGGFGLTEKGWNTRIPDQVTLVKNSGADLFFPTELHADPDKNYSGLPNGGAAYFLTKLKLQDADWDCVAAFKGGNGCYFRPSVYQILGYKPVYYTKKDPHDSKSRNFNDFTIKHKASGFIFHVLNTHFEYRSGATPDNVRVQSMRQILKYAESVGYCMIVGDFNSSSEQKNSPRWLARQAGWLGLRDRGSVTNGTQSTMSSSSKKSYWLDEIFTRSAQAVSGSALVKTNGASDHNGWLKTTVTWAAAGAPQPSPSTLPPGTASGPLPTSIYTTDTRTPWTASVRLQDGTLIDPLKFSMATLVENFNAPDTLSLTGRIDGLRPGVVAGYGCLLYDGTGTPRFSGQLTSIERLGDGTANLVYTGDLARLWYRLCYPMPTADWTSAGQSSVYHTVTGPAETRLLTLIEYNIGSSANSDRIDSMIRLPVNQGRGASGTTSARFDILGQLVATLAESANLRIRALQVYDSDGTPHIDLGLTEPPDMAAWAGFGDPSGGGPWMLSPDWRYKIDFPTVTTALSAAGGTGTDRILNAISDDDAEDVWGMRVEALVNQAGSTDLTEIQDGIDQALDGGSGAREISVPVGRSFGLGTVIPVGSTVSATLDGEVVSDRIRQLTTILSGESGTRAVAVSAVIGTPDAGPVAPTQKQLATALRRLQILERG